MDYVPQHRRQNWKEFFDRLPPSERLIESNKCFVLQQAQANFHQ